MKQAHKERPRHLDEDPEQVAGVDVARSPVRCPYCHDACTAEDARAIVCQQCLSRHHGACWREGHGQCASCGSKKALAGAPPTIVVAPAELELLRRGATREATERVARRCGVDEVDALTALLEAAGRELQQAGRTAVLGLPPWAVVAIVLGSMPFMVPLLAIIFGA